MAEFDPINFSQSLGALGVEQGAAPVALWNPPFCGHIDLEIKTDGLWYYMGTPITRPSLVKLFARVLKKEGEDYFLVTPHEKLGIRVQDVPFVITSVVRSDASQLVFKSALGERIVLDRDHTLKIKYTPAGEPKPYLHVRHGLYGRILRPVYYQLVEMAHTRMEAGEMVFSLESADFICELGRVPVAE